MKRVKQNILVDSAGHARLSDIGFAKLVPTGEFEFDWAQDGAEGCRWAAPEIFRKGELTEQSDIFAYGFVSAEVRPSNPPPHITVTVLAQIFTGSLLWKEIDEMELRSKILNGERPHRPEAETKHALIEGLWRIFARCWGKDPAGRVSASEVLNVLQYLWVLTSLLRVHSADSLHDPSPQKRSGSYNSKIATTQGKDQHSQERIDGLDKGGCQIFSPIPPG